VLTPILRVRGLKKDYPIKKPNPGFFASLIGRAWGWTGQLDDWRRLNDGLTVLRGVDLDVHNDETLAIVGPSGAGKSTLLHLMGALDTPTDGSVIYRGRDLAAMDGYELDHYRNRKIGLVFQFYHLFPDLNALENVLVPAMVACSPAAWLASGGKYRARARELLERVRLVDRARHRPSQLSGGEQQRVAIARALLLEPELLLCDEPTGNLDRRTGEEVLDLLWELKAKHGQTYVIVTHDHRLADRADRKIEMIDGHVKETGGNGASVEKPAATPVVEKKD
jgi:lipoprotein-releasing system ATP-binding protein